MENISLTAEQLINSWETRANELMKQNVILQAMVEKLKDQYDKIKDEITIHINEVSLLKLQVDTLQLEVLEPELHLTSNGNGHSLSNLGKIQ